MTALALRVRLQHEQHALSKLVNEEKFQEAIAQGEQLLKEFPKDPELTRLVDYARAQQAQMERARRRKEKFEELQALLAKGDLAQAISVAEKALEAFPGDAEFTRILDDTRKQQKEKEKKEYLEKQIRGIKSAMETGNLTDAIDLGRQTLAVVKQDTDVTQLLQFAEREYQFREKQREINQQLDRAKDELATRLEPGLRGNAPPD
jgi:tetratricopeptide (TPR) repeat protein